MRTKIILLKAKQHSSIILGDDPCKHRLLHNNIDKELGCFHIIIARSLAVHNICLTHLRLQF